MQQSSSPVDGSPTSSPNGRRKVSHSKSKSLSCKAELMHAFNVQHPYGQNYPKGKAGEPHCWDEVDATLFSVRGKTYMTDRVKVPSPPAILKLLDADYFLSKERLDQWALREESLVQQLKKKGDTRFKFVLVLQFPPHHMACTWVLEDPDQTIEDVDPIFAALWKKFAEGNEEFQNNRLKLIPRVVEGGFLVKKTLRSKPTLLGNKLKCRYFNYDDNVFEIDCDVFSSEISRTMINMIKRYTKELSFDVALVIQGNEEDELPERVFAGINFSKVNIDGARVVDGIESGLEDKKSASGEEDKKEKKGGWRLW
ncbi:START domain-containing protein [Balamuthia mandrillaris]